MIFFCSEKTAGETADDLQLILHKTLLKRRASVLITTNRIIEDWHLCLGDAALTTAILDPTPAPERASQVPGTQAIDSRKPLLALSRRPPSA